MNLYPQISKEDFTGLATKGNFLGCTEKQLNEKFTCKKAPFPEFSLIPESFLPDNFCMLEVTNEKGITMICSLFEPEECFSALFHIDRKDSERYIGYCKESFTELSKENWQYDGVIIRLMISNSNYLYSFSLADAHFSMPSPN